jgi:hypothetical protein
MYSMAQMLHITKAAPNFGEFLFRNCLEIREGGVSAVLFTDAQRQNRPP